MTAPSEDQNGGMPSPATASPETSRIDRFLQRCVWGLALVPPASLVLIASLVLRTRLALGRWPHPYQPDPKDVGYVHYLVVFFSEVGAVYSPFLLALCALVAGVRQPASIRRSLAAFMLCVGLLAGFIWLHYLDPWELSTWLAD